jgi:2-polyprenyl-3-methyl-5-hydroxy-6-metoxy-1,4-benzoquinol methylase
MAILAHNHYPTPERWIAVAQREAFQRVDATPLAACPDCGASLGPALGQYVYYSTLMHLRTCPCGLIYTDQRLPLSIFAAHFQVAYKDETYFVRHRHAIFDHLSLQIAARARHGARVLDAGGAKGHLMAILRQKRPDLNIMLNDLSPMSCEWAAHTYGLRTQVGGLADIRGEYDVVVISDSLYYVHDLPVAWTAITRLVCPGGQLWLRLPNKVRAIRAGQWFSRDALQTRVKGFNEEHLYIFTRPYLRRRLSAIGFHDVRFMGSPTLNTGHERLLGKAWLRRLALTPSVLVSARH